MVQIYYFRSYTEVQRACSHPSRDVRLQAYEALEKEYLNQVDADFLLRLLRKASAYEEQSEILSILGQLGDRMPVDDLISILLDRTTAIPRYQVALDLAALGEQAPIELFMSLLRDTTEEVGLRETLAELLGRFGEHVSLEVLLETMTDAEPAVCAAVIGALTIQGTQIPLEPILAQLGHPVWYVRKAAVRALCFAGEHVPIDPIVAALQDTDARVRTAAADGLALLLERLGERVPTEPLIDALRDSEADVRESAWIALSKLPSAVPLDLVVRALDDENPYVVCAALTALERMGSERVPQETFPKLSGMAEAPDAHPSVRRYAARALAALKGLPPPRELTFPGEEL